jgi:hypothetical protein
MADIYISSSWKNRERVRAVAIRLREAGLTVYDFTDPACRNGVPEIPPERFPEQFDPAKHHYPDYIRSVPEWRQAVDCNREEIRTCRAILLLLPCGMDGHADAFYGLGLGRLLAVVGAPKTGDRAPTHMWADAILDTDDDAVQWAASLPLGGYCASVWLDGKHVYERGRCVHCRSLLSSPSPTQEPPHE